MNHSSSFLVPWVRFWNFYYSISKPEPCVTSKLIILGFEDYLLIKAEDAFWSQYRAWRNDSVVAAQRFLVVGDAVQVVANLGGYKTFGTIVEVGTHSDFAVRVVSKFGDQYFDGDGCTPYFQCHFIHTAFQKKFMAESCTTLPLDLIHLIFQF